jgi:acyl-CoA synthetase (AMP-forming)/AMP-acid ligase II
VPTNGRALFCIGAKDDLFGFPNSPRGHWSQPTSSDRFARGHNLADSFNVPSGYALLCVALRNDPVLKQKFFHRIQRMIFGGAAISAPVMATLQELAIEARGERIPIMAGYGATESAPTICMSYRPCEAPREICLPAPGVELKLIRAMDAYEVRLCGRPCAVDETAEIPGGIAPRRRLANLCCASGSNDRWDQ